MLTRLLLLLLALACKARVERVVEQPKARPLPPQVESEATHATQLELKLGADGMVRLHRLQLAGDLLIDGAVLRPGSQLDGYQLAWKSWQGEKKRLIWQQQMDAAKLAQQNGIYLPRSGLGLGEAGLFGAEVLLFSQGKILAQNLLPLVLDPQSYQGGGWEGQLRGSAADSAVVLAFEAEAGKAAVTRSNAAGSFYLKLPYSGRYTLIALGTAAQQLHAAVLPAPVTEQLAGVASRPVELHLQALAGSSQQSWLLPARAARLQAVTEGKELRVQLPADIDSACLVTVALATPEGQIYLRSSTIAQGPRLQVPEKVLQHPDALLLVLIPGYRPHSELLNPALIEQAPLLQAGESDPKPIPKDRSIQLNPVVDQTPQPELRMPQSEALSINSETLMSSAVADKSVHGYHWLVNGQSQSNDSSFTYRLGDDYSQKNLLITLQLQDRWGNNFQRRYQLPVQQGKVRWDCPLGPGPYWIKGQKKEPDLIPFLPKIPIKEKRIDLAKQHFDWSLWQEDAKGEFVPLDSSLAAVKEHTVLFSGLESQALQLGFTRAGRYRLQVALSSAYLLQLSEAESSFQQEFVVEAAPEGLQIEGPQQVKPGEEAVFSAVLSNAAQLQAKNLQYRWLVEGQDKLPPGFNVRGKQLFYHSPLSNARNQQWQLRVEVSDGFYPQPAAALHQFSEKPFSLTTEIAAPAQLLRPGEDYQFKVSNSSPPAGVSSDALSYHWQLQPQQEGSLRGNSSGTGAAFSLHFLQAGRYTLSLEPSYSDASGTHRLPAVTRALQVYSYPQTPQLRASTPSSGILQLHATVENLAALQAEGNPLSYRWFEAQGPSLKNLEPEVLLDPTKLPAGYSIQNEILRLTHPQVNSDNTQRVWRVEISDQLLGSSSSSSTYQTNLKISTGELELWLNSQALSSDMSSPTAIGGSQTLRLQARVLDPHLQAQALKLELNSGTGIQINPSQVEWSKPIDSGHRLGEFSVTLAPQATASFSLRLRAQTNKNSWQERRYYFKVEQARPESISLSYPLRAQREELSQKVGQPHLLDPEHALPLQLKFQDPGERIGQSWYWEWIQEGAAQRIDSSHHDINLSVPNHTREGEQQQASFEISLEAGVPALQSVQLRLHLGSSGVSRDFFLQRRTISPRNWELYRKVGPQDYLLERRELDLPDVELTAGIHERFYVRIYDPDQQLGAIRVRVQGRATGSSEQLQLLPFKTKKGMRVSELLNLNFQGASTLQFELLDQSKNSLQPAQIISLNLRKGKMPSDLALTTSKGVIVLQSQEKATPSKLPAGGFVEIAASIKDPHRMVYRYSFSSSDATDFSFFPKEGCRVMAFQDGLPRSDLPCQSSYLLNKALPAKTRRSFTVTAHYHDGTPLNSKSFQLEVPAYSWTQHYPWDHEVLNKAVVHAVDGWEDQVLLASDKGLIQTSFDPDPKKLALGSRQLHFYLQEISGLKVVDKVVVVGFPKKSSARLQLGALRAGGDIIWQDSLLASIWEKFGSAKDIGSLRLLRVMQHSSGETLLLIADDGRAPDSPNLLVAKLQGLRLQIVQRQKHDSADYLEDLAVYGDMFFLAAQGSGLERWQVSKRAGEYVLERLEIYAGTVGGHLIGNNPQDVEIIGDRLLLASWTGLFHGSLKPDSGQWQIAGQAHEFGERVKRVFFDGQQLLVQNYRQLSSAYIGEHSALIRAQPHTLAISEYILTNTFNVGGSLRLDMYHSKGRYVFPLLEVTSNNFGIASERGESHNISPSDSRGINLLWQHS